VAARGLSDDADADPAHLEFGVVIAAHKEHVLVLAWAGGKPAGTGSVKIDQDIAWLSADSTLPEFRRQGVQQAVQRYRLDLAREAGCSLVVTEAVPGSGSQRNMERLGFHVMYTHLHFAKV
jgi:GNAT superfamily N-acetyltransferase